MAEYKTYETLTGNIVIEEVDKPSSGGYYCGPFATAIVCAVFFPWWGPIYFLYKQLAFLFGFIRIKCTGNTKLLRALKKTQEYYQKYSEGLPAVVPYVWTKDYEKQVAEIKKKYAYASEDVIHSKIKTLRDEDDPPKPFVRYRYDEYENTYYFSLDEKGNLMCKLGDIAMNGYDWEEDLDTLGHSLSKQGKAKVMDFFFGE